MKDNNLPIHYRYSDYLAEDGLHIMFQEFYPIRETKCFYFCVDSWQKNFLDRTGKTYGKVRRVSKDSLRRFCYPTKKEALNSYKKRKESQNFHSEANLQKSTMALKYLSEIEIIKDSDTFVGKPEITNRFIFD